MKKSGLVQGAFIATICIIITKLLGIAYVIPFYSIIGQTGGALYGYAYSIYEIFLMLSSIGIPLAISRLTSEYNSLEQYHLKEKTFKVGRNIIIILSAVSFLVLIIFAPSIANIFIGDITGGNTKEDVTFVIRVVSTALLIAPVLSITRGYLQGHRFIALSSISQVLEQLFRVLVIVIGSYVMIKVLGLPIRTGVGIAVFGATIGGVIAYIYLLIKMQKHKNDLHQVDVVSRETSKITTKKIVLKIVTYSIPFIFMSLIMSFYNFIDMSTVIKTLVNRLNYDVVEAETVLSILSTWGAKLNMIVASIATGLVTSLIPNISGSFVKKNYADVRHKINQSIQTLLYVTIPMTVGLSLLSTPVWTIFYGYNILSSKIFQYSIFVILFFSLLTTLNVILQFLNENKRTFIYISIGLIVKLIFNIPLMHSFQKMGLHASYGVITASILGYSTSILLILWCLHKKIGVNYEETVNRLVTIIYACLVMSLVVLSCQLMIPVNTANRFMALLLVGFYSILGSSIYLFITARRGLIIQIFGKSLVNKILGKLKLNKIIKI